MFGHVGSTDGMAVSCGGSRLSTCRARAGRGAAHGDRAWVRRRTWAIQPSRSTCQCGCCETVIRRGGAAMAHRGAGGRRHGSEIDRWHVARHCFGRPAPFLLSGLDPFGPTMSRTRGPGARPTSVGDGGRFLWRGDALDPDALSNALTMDGSLLESDFQRGGRPDSMFCQSRADSSWFGVAWPARAAASREDHPPSPPTRKNQGAFGNASPMSGGRRAMPCPRMPAPLQRVAEEEQTGRGKALPGASGRTA